MPNRRRPIACRAGIGILVLWKHLNVEGQNRSRIGGLLRSRLHASSGSNDSVSGGVRHGLVEQAEPPKYPEEALKYRTQGGVIFKVVVDESGKIILSIPLEGDPLMNNDFCCEMQPH